MNAEAARRTSHRFATRRVLRIVGRIVLLAWAGFWTWFNLASLIGEMADLGVWINHGLLAAVIVAVTVLAFLWPRVGGIALLVLTVGLAVFFRGVEPFVALIFLAPPAVAGLLTLVTAPRGP